MWVLIYFLWNKNLFLGIEQSLNPVETLRSKVSWGSNFVPLLQINMITHLNLVSKVCVMERTLWVQSDGPFRSIWWWPWDARHVGCLHRQASQGCPQDSPRCPSVWWPPPDHSKGWIDQTSLSSLERTRGGHSLVCPHVDGPWSGPLLHCTFPLPSDCTLSGL